MCSFLLNLSTTLSSFPLNSFFFCGVLWYLFLFQVIKYIIPFKVVQSCEITLTTWASLTSYIILWHISWKRKLGLNSKIFREYVSLKPMPTFVKLQNYVGTWNVSLKPIPTFVELQNYVGTCWVFWEHQFLIVCSSSSLV